MNEQFESTLLARHRIVSRFHCQELLFDYQTGQLDEPRRHAVAEYIPTCRETQKELEALKRGIKYAEFLSRADVSPGLIERVRHTRVGWAYWSEKMAWRNWPESAQWTVEGVLISMIVALVVSVLPLNRIAKWLPFQTKEVVLAETERAASPGAEDIPTVVPEVTAPVKDQAPEPPAPPTKPVNEKRPLAEVAVEPKIEIVNVSPSGKIIAKTEPKPEPKVESKPAPQAAATANQKADVTATAPAAVAHVATPAEQIETDSEDGAPQAGSKRTAGPKGFVYRAFMSTGVLDQTTEEMKSRIEQLGGQKAGQVELGWHKGTGTYFHFTLPESNYEQLQTLMRSLGPVRIYRDSHWRVMPEGEIRIILYIEDSTSKK